MFYIKSKNIALAFGMTFIVSGVLGFIPNPIVYTDGFFEVNSMHNIVHLLTGTVFLGTATLGAEKTAKLVLQIIGISYTAVAILGFLTEGQLLLGVIHINEADKWLHVGLAILILITGFGLAEPQKQVT